jgi:hypothetical protein
MLLTHLNHFLRMDYFYTVKITLIYNYVELFYVRYQSIKKNYLDSIFTFKL